MRIRQIALVAADLDKTLADLCAVFGLEVGLRDPGVATFGLRNGVMPIGEHFLEVVSPAQEGTSAGRYLDRRKGDGGYMVIFQTRDLAAARTHLAANDVKIVWEIALDDIATIHLHPRDNRGAIVSMDEARPWESWRWGGPEWRSHVRTTRVSAIAGVEIQCDDPAALAKQWSQIFQIPFADADNRLALKGGESISFVKISDDRGEGIRSVELRAVDADAARVAARERGLVVEDEGTICIAGTRFVLV